jgi:hypothetical protein
VISLTESFQALVCSADGTLEEPRSQTNLKTGEVETLADGEKQLHQCKDASMLWVAASRSEYDPVVEKFWQEGDSIQKIFGKLWKS